MACCILILFYVQDERSFDRFHEKADRIYRIVNAQKVSGEGIEYITSMPGPMAEIMVLEYPEVVNAVKLYKWFERKLLRAGERKFYIENFVYTNKSFFDVFDFQMLRGDSHTALS